MKQWLGFLGGDILKVCIVAIAAVLVLGSGFAAAQVPLPMPEDAQKLEIITGSGKKLFVLEIAHTDEKRSAGLMYRTDFSADRAMIFVFDDERPVMMWMANTPLPLDMLFVRKDGTIARIAENTKPFSKDIIASGEPVAFVIEVNAGTAARLGIKPGDKVRHRIICGQCE